MKENFLKNVQLYPSDECKITIDNLTRKAFELCIDGKSDEAFNLKESRAKNIQSTVAISNLDKLKIKFDEFHWAVFDACVSIIKDGYDYTTLAILRRKLGGAANKKSSDNKVVDLTLDKDIQTAIEELAMVRIAVNMEDTKKFYDSPLESGKFEFNGYILANENLKMSVNGQAASLYHFPRRSILFVTSEMKNQVITTDQEFFNPPIRMTRRSIAINHFLLRRILEMKGSLEASKSNKKVKPLRHTILFDSLYRACGLESENRYVKQNARDIVVKILQYFIEKELIKGYEIETGRGGKARAIHFEL